MRRDATVTSKPVAAPPDRVRIDGLTVSLMLAGRSCASHWGDPMLDAMPEAHLLVRAYQLAPIGGSEDEKERT